MLDRFTPEEMQTLKEGFDKEELTRGTRGPLVEKLLAALTADPGNGAAVNIGRALLMQGLNSFDRYADQINALTVTAQTPLPTGLSTQAQTATGLPPHEANWTGGKL